MIIPTLPVSLPIEIKDKKFNETYPNINVDWSSEWIDFWIQLLGVLQTNLSNEGLVWPSLTATQIAQLDPTKMLGTTFYNSTADTYMGTQGGLFKTFTLS